MIKKEGFYIELLGAFARDLSERPGSNCCSLSVSGGIKLLQDDSPGCGMTCRQAGVLTYLED